MSTPSRWLDARREIARMRLLLTLLLCLAVVGPLAAQTLKTEGFYFLDKPSKLIPEFRHIAMDQKGGGWLFVGPRRYSIGGSLSKGGKYEFQSESIRGTSIHFSGKFLKMGDFAKDQPQGAVLQGVLTVQRPEGKSRENVNFTYSVGD